MTGFHDTIRDKMSRLLVLVVLLTTIATAHSQCYGQNYNYSHGSSYYPRVEYVDRLVPVAYPVPFHVAIPVVSYLFNGASYAPAYTGQPSSPAQGGYAQLARSQPQAQQQYATTQSQPQYAAAQSPGALTDAQLDALIARIEQRLLARQNQPASQPDTQQEMASPPPHANVNPEAWLRQSRGNESLSCASCHTGSQSKGGIQIFLPNGQFNQRVSRKKLYDSIYDMRMPHDRAGKPDQSAFWADAEVDALGKTWGLAQ